MVQGERLRDRPANVVADEDKLLVPEVHDELTDVLHQRACQVGVYILRLGGQVVTTKVGRHDEMILRELGELVAELIPALRKAVKEENQWTLPSMGIVEPYAVYLGIVMAEITQLSVPRFDGHRKISSHPID
jgi:hypothetical protein